MVIYLAIALFFITIIFIFSSPALSPVPYFPSNKKDMKLIIKALDLKNNQTVVDLGAGDGIVILEAAEEAMKKRLDTKFVAVEINPVLILVLHVRRLFQANKKNIKIVRSDMFGMDFSSLIQPKAKSLFYIYISPWHIGKTLDNIKRQYKKFSVVSYMYPVKSLKPKQELQGLHRVFLYYI